MRIFHAFALLALMSTAAHAQEGASAPPPPLVPGEVVAILEKAVDGAIRPGYAAFSDSTGRLGVSLRALCETPSTATLDSARAAFKATAAQWARIEIVRAGPVLQDNRFERILYYPDRKGLGLRQVQALLAEQDASVLEVGALEGKSVAVQGLGALEFVLYGTGSDGLAKQAEPYRCRYGVAVADNVARIARQLDEAWAAPDGIAAVWTRPGAENPQFRSVEEAATGLLGLLVHGAEAMRDQRVEGFYKGVDKATFPKQALFWRSGNTFTMISGNIDGLRTLFDASGIGALLGRDQIGTVDSIHFLMANMERVSNAANPDIEALMADARGRGQMEYLLVAGKDLILRFNDELGGAIGLSAGFSFQDGD